MSRWSFVYRVTDHPFANCLSVAPPPWLYLGKADRNGDRKDYPHGLAKNHSRPK
jgi:hypothetical protein